VPGERGKKKVPAPKFSDEKAQMVKKGGIGKGESVQAPPPAFYLAARKEGKKKGLRVL